MGKVPSGALGLNPEFRKWMVLESANLTNKELVAAVREKFGREVSYSTLEGLRKRYGKPISPETLRRAYDERSKSMPSVARSKEMLSPTERMDRASLEGEVRRLSARQTFFEVVGEKIIEAVRRIPNLPPPRDRRITTRKGLHEEEMVLLLSDVQAGQITSAKESGGLGAYNTEILLAEIQQLLQAIESIRFYHPNVRTLNIFALGDIVEGETIFEGQQRLIDQNVVQQVILCWEEFGRFFRSLAGMFDQVRCYGVVGNHGRIGKKGVHGPLSNLDYLLYHMWQERLRPVKNLSWEISESWWKIAEVQGWRFLLVHGDDTQPGAWGIPFYGVTRTKVRYRELLRMAGVPDFDYLCIGHHHEPAAFQGAYMNGSWPGSSELSLKRMQLAGNPTQLLMGVYEKYGVTYERRLNLRPIVRLGHGNGETTE